VPPPSSERAQEPQSTYVPLTRDQIKALRGVLHKGGHEKTAWELKQWDTLCDMAVNALLYAQEIDRLRAANSASGARDLLLEAAAELRHVTTVGEEHDIAFSGTRALAVRIEAYLARSEGAAK
jgi:hypothetical protein